MACSNQAAPKAVLEALQRLARKHRLQVLARAAVAGNEPRSTAGTIDIIRRQHLTRSTAANELAAKQPKTTAIQSGRRSAI